MCIDCLNPHQLLKSINMYRKSIGLPEYESLTTCINEIKANGEMLASIPVKEKKSPTGEKTDKMCITPGQLGQIKRKSDQLQWITCRKFLPANKNTDRMLLTMLTLFYQCLKKDSQENILNWIFQRTLLCDQKTKRSLHTFPGNNTPFIVQFFAQQIPSFTTI